MANKHTKDCIFWKRGGSCNCGLLARLGIKKMNAEAFVALALYRKEHPSAACYAEHDVLVNGSHMNQARVAINAYLEFTNGAPNDQ